MGLIDDLVKFVLQIYALWAVAGLIVWAISMAYIGLVLGYVELMVALVTSMVFFLMPFPLDLYVAWELDRISLVGQGFVFFLLFLWLYLRSRNK